MFLCYIHTVYALSFTLIPRTSLFDPYLVSGTYLPTRIKSKKIPIHTNDWIYHTVPESLLYLYKYEKFEIPVFKYWFLFMLNSYYYINVFL